LHFFIPYPRHTDKQSKTLHCKAYPNSTFSDPATHPLGEHAPMLEGP
jgi:hypothetical protein